MSTKSPTASAALAAPAVPTPTTDPQLSLTGGAPSAASFQAAQHPLSRAPEPLSRVYGYSPVDPVLTQEMGEEIGNGGFSYARDDRLPYSQGVKLILPVPLLDAMAAECKAHDEALNARVKEREQFPMDGKGDDGGADDPYGGDDSLGIGPNQVGTVTSPKKLPLGKPYEGRPSLTVPVYPPDEIEVLTQAAKSRSKTEKLRYEEAYKTLKAMGHLRHLLYPACQGQHLNQGDTAFPAGCSDAAEQPMAPMKANPQGSEQVAARSTLDAQLAFIRAEFDRLHEYFPHFGEVIEIYRTSALAAARTGGVMSPPPVLMLGVPGVGKTHFAQALAQCMDLPMVKLAFDSGLTNAALLGSDQHWSNTHHGQLFEYLCMRQVANPVFFLDELDKASMAKGTSGYQSALAALHSCLEPSSAAMVKDISFGMHMDASHVTWLAATNDVQSIQPSLRSRFTEVVIRPPVDPEAMYRLNWHLCASVLKPLGLATPGSDIRTSLAVLSPRDQRKHLQTASQHAMAEGRDHLLPEDFAQGVVQTDGTASSPPRSQGQGLGRGVSQGGGRVRPGKKGPPSGPGPDGWLQ